MDGVLNLNKPQGPTSFRAVSKIRRISGVSRAGHGGTLDPFACGVLPVLLGKATRTAEYFLDWSKTYRAQIMLGAETDTLDNTGAVIATAETSKITSKEVEKVIPQFIGDVLQKPPIYSAIKQEGRRLYQMAREGLAPEPASRTVSIYEIKIISFQLPYLTIEVTCGRGTYIRSLARDLGLALESRAHLSKLERTAYGPLSIKDAVSLDDINEERGKETIQESLLPLDTGLSHLSKVELTPGETLLVGRGSSIYRQNMPGVKDAWRAYDENGNLAALLIPGQTPHWYRPRKVFIGARNLDIQASNSYIS